jgi:hypothetical protein
MKKSSRRRSGLLLGIWLILTAISGHPRGLFQGVPPWWLNANHVPPSSRRLHQLCILDTSYFAAPRLLRRAASCIPLVTMYLIVVDLTTTYCSAFFFLYLTLFRPSPAILVKIHLKTNTINPIQISIQLEYKSSVPPTAMHFINAYAQVIFIVIFSLFTFVITPGSVFHF